MALGSTRQLSELAPQVLHNGEAPTRRQVAHPKVFSIAALAIFALLHEPGDAHAARGQTLEKFAERRVSVLIAIEYDRPNPAGVLVASRGIVAPSRSLCILVA